jgi:putative ABC transport system permease protein
MRQLTLVRKNLTRRIVRTILVIASIAVAFLIFGFLNAFRLASVTGAQSENATRLEVSNKISFTQPLPISDLQQIAGIGGVRAVTHRTWFGGYYREPSNFVVTYAVDPKSYFDVFPETGADAAAIAAFGARRDGALVGTAIARKFGLKPGDRLPLFSTAYARAHGRGSWDLQVVGLLPSSKGQFQNTVLMNYDYLDEGRTFGKGTVSQFVLATTGAGVNDRVTAAIDAKFANSLAETSTMTEAKFNQAFLTQFADVSSIVLLVTAAAFASILMITGTTMVAAVRERRHEIGLLYAVGFNRRRVAAQLLSEALLLATIGGLIGMGSATTLLGGMRAAAQGQLDHIVLAPAIWGDATLIMLAFALLAAAVPMLLVHRMNLAQSLRRS